MKRNNIALSRTLRRDQTDAEIKLWSALRDRQLSGVKFRRQFSIGRFIIDFYSPEFKLGIEADGGQHYDDKGSQRDELRTRELADLGVQIIRFSNLEILNHFDGVCQVIQEAIEKKRENSPSPSSSPRRGEEMTLD
jgi:very-short-patch-repair endonuclease